ncbi:DUF1127 domain-containing protein [Variovorax sp. YR216]|uniref:DUF1127 domain-containing protein n=1 Tax=Variovorax sp. YR216 TaxID=1882828 RepID=UPI00089964D4|nr:DUF1127 domain-containing protein [Variovorax sp. YR216]SEB23055.1 protein of unknown function [Variovorax sp. YR216]
MQTPKPALVAAVLDLIRKARRARQDHRQLRAMSERELRDLGVGRSEIPALLSDAAAPSNAPYSRARCAADARRAMPR